MWRPIAPVGGAIHDVARLKGMDLEPCYVVVVSQTTLNIIQNYAIDEISYLSRFGVEFKGGYYVPVDAYHADYEFVLDVVRRYRLEVNDMTCDLVEAIDSLTVAVQAIATCCSERGGASIQDVDSPPSDGVVSVGQPGDQFGTTAEYTSAKCAVSNAIYDTILGFVSDIDQTDVEAIVSGIWGGPTAILASKLASSGPLGWAISKVSMALVQLAFMFIDAVVDFSDISDALDDQHEELVCSLYTAGDTVEAKSEFLAALALATPTLTAAETLLVSTLLTYDLLNQLYSPRPDVVAYVSDDPIDCSSCAGACDWVWELIPGETYTAGTGDLGKNRTVTLYSAYYPGYGHYIRFDAKEVIVRDCLLEFTVNSVSFASGELIQWQVHNGTDWDSYSYANIGAAARCAAAVDLAASVFWSMSITFVDTCP